MRAVRMAAGYREDATERLLRWMARQSQRARYAHWTEDPRQALALQTIADVVDRLRGRGHWVTRTGHNDPFDLLVSGLRVEVKAAMWSSRRRRYQANLRGNQADVLILGCRNGQTHYFLIPFEQVRGLRNIAIWSVEPEQYTGRWRAFLEKWGIIDELIARGVNHWQMGLPGTTDENSGSRELADAEGG